MELVSAERHIPSSAPSSSGRLGGLWGGIQAELAWVRPLLPMLLCLPIFQRCWQVYAHLVPQVQALLLQLHACIKPKLRALSS